MDTVKKHIKSYIGWGIFFIAFTGFIYFYNTSLTFNIPKDTPHGIVHEKAKVTKIISENIDQDPDFSYINIGIQELELEILTGDFKGEKVVAKNFIGRVDNKPAEIGTKYVVSTFDEFKSTLIVNYSRENSMYVLVIAFIAIVIAIGKWKGVKSILGLLFTMVCIIFLFIPMVIRGVSPITSSIIVVILSTVVTMLLLNGLSKKTLVSCFSCILCTALAGVIAYIFGQANNISTFNTQEAEDLLFISTNTALNVKNMLFAGILISSLGAIMDTTMSIASSIFEMKDVNEKMTSKQLFKSGMNVGKDVMGTMTNTLILAFTGSSINILIMYFMYKMPYMQLINIDVIVIEILQGLSGGIAIILSIPVTAIIAARLADSKINIDKINSKVFSNKKTIANNKAFIKEAK